MDQYWRDVIAFIEGNKWQGTILASDQLMRHIRGSRSLSRAVADRVVPTDYTMLALHKDDIDSTNAALILDTAIAFLPVFANEVFVVFAQNKPGLDSNHLHLKSLRATFEKCFRQVPSMPNVVRQPGAIYIGGGILLATLRDGQKIYLDSSDISLTPHIALDGYWEDWITQAFLSNVEPGMTVVDIGANCGYYSLLAARAVGSKGFTIAIDANPFLCDLVHRSLCVNGYTGRSSVINAAVMDREGEIAFAIPKKFKGSATFVREGVDFTPFGDSHDIIKVQGSPLASLVQNRKVDVLKIDAEGAEPLIVRGSESFFASQNMLKVVMEFAPSHFASIITGADFLDYLGRLGFGTFLIQHDGSTKSASRSEVLEHEHCDLLLVK